MCPANTERRLLTESTLSAAAFGDRPGCWPLPSATTPYQRWLRAVAAGGQGRYGSALSDLAPLLRTTTAGRLASLAHSTRGSFLRQLGWHARARRWDGAALALAGDDAEAAGDALIGLAADALGVRRFAAADTLLRRADKALAAGGPGAQRPAVRRAWVAAELAMAHGEGCRAVRHAEQAVELAQAISARHRVKSDMVLAAALCSAGDIDRARALGDDTLDAAAQLGLVPLRWALACLLIDIGSARRTTQQLRSLRHACAEHVRRAGGIWRER
ncbi:MAG TPA: hypothetical protein VFA16_12295 [Mycobacterium sp.]|uniref:hypothetical protein n=1 Tax=Mycobacterium TaxID=1763 RepID=UPI0019435D4D|nr:MULTISPECIES: hypothetical protein [Mycobacterium]BCQ10331.1 hypothetical protein JMUB5695_03786 [Mycobacterium heckeshornense]HZU48008.1 hypothetical protein [Mycobacterium sp.]